MRKIIVGLCLALSVLISLAQDKPVDLGQIKEEFVTTWILTVENDPNERLVDIKNITGQSENYILETIYGVVGTNGAPVKLDLAAKQNQPKTISLSRGGSKVIASQSPDGIFKGTLTDPRGKVMNMTFRKISREDLQAKMEATTAKPGPDVPKSCAAFFGSWSGRWAIDQGGVQVLRVAAIQNNCSAVYSYIAKNGISLPFLKPVNIEGGVLSFPCGDQSGTCVFRVAENALNGSYTNPSGGRNSAQFTPEK